MKKIILEQLTFLNFKGIRKLTVNFNEKETNIYGDNATGKTTIFDGFCYLLFGKDSAGKTDFNIKTLDGNNNVIWQLPHEVSGVLWENQTKLELKRSYVERWEKPTGQQEKVFRGHKTLYYVNTNEVPKSVYEETVNSLIDENVFKLLTNPLQFNNFKEPPLSDWETRRNYLFKIAGEVSDEDIVKQNPVFSDMFEKYKSSKIHGLNEYKKNLSSQVNKLNSQKENIPVQIEENLRNMPAKIDFAAIEKEIEGYEEKIKEVDGKIEDSTTAHQGILNEINQKNEEINTLTRKLSTIQFEAEQLANKETREAQAKKTAIETDLKEKQENLKWLERSLNFLVTEPIPEKEKLISQKRTEWNEENAKKLELSEEKVYCPLTEIECTVEETLKFNKDKQSEALANFNKKKTETLERINREGQEMSKELSLLKEKARKYEKDIEDTKVAINIFQKQLLEIGDISVKEPEETEAEKNLLAQIEKVKLSIPEKPVVDNVALKTQKEGFREKIDQLKGTLSNKDRIIELEARNEELRQEQLNVAQHIADLEKIKNDIEGFMKVKIDAVEKPVNNLFKYARFKMYEDQISADAKETCVTLLNGNPWSDLSHGERIFVGCDIIDTFSKFFDINVVRFIDERESTTRIPETDSQVINLHVVKDDSKSDKEEERIAYTKLEGLLKLKGWINIKNIK